MSGYDVSRLQSTLDNLKRDYAIEVKKNNLQKAEDLKIQIYMLFLKIKKIKDEENDTLKSKDLVRSDELSKPLVDSYDEPFKSFKETKKELKYEKKKLRKEVKNKEKEKKLEIKNIEKKRKVTELEIKKTEAYEKKQSKKLAKLERGERKKSQLKEAKSGTIFLFVLLILLFLLISSRGFVFHQAYIKTYQGSVRYIDMYNFFIKFSIILVGLTTFLFTFFQRKLERIGTIRIFTILFTIFLFLSFDGLAFLDLRILRGDTYFIFPGLLLLIVIDLVGKNIVRDKIYYDFDYS